MVEGAYQTIIAPFNEMEVPVVVRCPNPTQLRACGSFSIIDIRDEVDKIEQAKEKVPDAIIADMVDKQEAILKETLVSPTYEEIVNDVYGQDGWYQELKENLKKVEAMIVNVKEPAERGILVTRLRMLKMQSGFMLPNDFTAFVVAWALNIDRSDIKKITKTMLLDAAILATRGHDNPSDHLIGNFNEYHYDEINKQAWVVYNEFEENKRQEKSGVDEIRGGKAQPKAS